MSDWFHFSFLNADTPFVKRVSKSESAVYQKDRNIILKEEPFSKVSSNVNYSIEEVNEEDFLESLGNFFYFATKLDFTMLLWGYVFHNLCEWF